MEQLRCSMPNRMLRIAALAAFALAAVRPLSAPAAAGDEAAPLLAKHRAYVGWAAGDGGIKTLRETGAAVRDGHTVAAISALRYGVAYRNTYRRPNGIQSDDGFTGSVFWTSNANGFTVRPVGEVIRYLADVAALFGEGTADAGGALLRHETLAGADTAVVRLTPQVGFPMDVWIDPSTGAYRRAVLDPGGKYETAFNGLEYAEAAGKRCLASWHVGSSKTTYRYDKIEVEPGARARRAPPAQADRDLELRRGQRAGRAHPRRVPAHLRRRDDERRQGPLHLRHRRGQHGLDRCVRAPHRRQTDRRDAHQRHRRQRRGEPLPHRRDRHRPLDAPRRRGLERPGGGVVQSRGRRRPDRLRPARRRGRRPRPGREAAADHGPGKGAAGREPRRHRARRPLDQPHPGADAAQRQVRRDRHARLAATRSTSCSRAT